MYVVNDSESNVEEAKWEDGGQWVRPVCLYESTLNVNPLARNKDRGTEQIQKDHEDKGEFKLIEVPGYQVQKPVPMAWLLASTGSRETRYKNSGDFSRAKVYSTLWESLGQDLNGNQFDDNVTGPVYESLVDVGPDLPLVRALQSVLAELHSEKKTGSEPCNTEFVHQYVESRTLQEFRDLRFKPTQTH